MQASIRFIENCTYSPYIIPLKECFLHHLSLVMRKPAFCTCVNKDADQLCGNVKLIRAFVFATRIVQSL